MLQGKKVLIVGMMSERSIAYGIASKMFEHGAQLGFSSLPRFRSRVEKMSKDWSSFLINECDVTSDDEIANLVEEVKNSVGKIDVLIHSIAFAPRDHLESDLLENLTREGFRVSQEVSSYSLAALTKSLLPVMNDNGAICTLTYLGSERVVPHYNIMGPAKASLESMVRYLALACGDRNIRVNAVSSGPIKTPSAAGIKNMKQMVDVFAERSPIKKPVTADQVGNVCAFLCSDLASAVTGGVFYVDNGHNIMASCG